MRWVGSRKLVVAVVAMAAAAGMSCKCKHDGVEAVPEEGPMPTLRTGTSSPRPLPQVAGTLTSRHVETGDGALAGSYVVVELPDVDNLRGARVEVAGDPSALGVSVDDRTLLIRFASAKPRSAVAGVLYTRRGEWTAVPFATRPSSSIEEDAELPRQWAVAYGNQLQHEADRAGGAHPWHAFARGRLAGLAEDRINGRPEGGRTVVRRSRLARLMATSTGMVSLQESLQHDRGLRLRFGDGERTVPVAELSPPTPYTHPWGQMRANLPEAHPEPEPLADATPADFWYFRFDSLRVLGVCLDEAEDWLIPARRIADSDAHDHHVVQRYRTQLGLEWTVGDALRMSTLADGVALVGSDPYLREGSDVTAIFATRDPSGVVAAVADMRTAKLGNVAPKPAPGGGSLYEHPSGLRQHVVIADRFVVVSNSPGAVAAVLRTIEGRRDRLADEPDFIYLRHRDPGAHDAFFYASDDFIAAVAGPKQKVLESRRQRALAELLTPGYAALLHGWLRGQPATHVPDLFASGLLAREELTHAGGEPIHFTLLTGARSSWGKPEFLTPLIDLPAPDLVSEEERGAYKEFADGYRDYWSKTIDPVAAGLDIEYGDDGVELRVHARVLPVVENTSFDDVRAVVGKAHVSVPSDLPGLRFTWAVGADVKLRRRVDSWVGSVGGGRDLGLGWLGSWVEVGVLDRKALAVVAAALDDRIQLPKEGPGGLARFAALSDAPVYVAAHVANKASLAAMLIAARTAASTAAPGMVEWTEIGSHAGQRIVELRGPKTGETTPSVYYAVADDVLVVAMTLPTMHAVLDRLARGHTSRPAPVGGQFVVDVAAAQDKGLATTLGWLFHAQALRAESAALIDAEVLLRGRPDLAPGPDWDAFALRTFGAVPVDATGSSRFDLGGAGPSSRLLGSTVAPHYPTLPVPGSPAHAIVRHLGAFRAAVSFAEEPGNPDRESLEVSLSIRTR